jgi:hypothetical protein
MGLYYHHRYDPHADLCEIVSWQGRAMQDKRVTSYLSLHSREAPAWKASLVGMADSVVQSVSQKLRPLPKVSTSSDASPEVLYSFGYRDLQQLACLVRGGLRGRSNDPEFACPVLLLWWAYRCAVQNC